MQNRFIFDVWNRVQTWESISLQIDSEIVNIDNKYNAHIYNRLLI